MKPHHTRKDVTEFLALHRIAMPGVSRDPKDFSRLLFADLRGRGYDVVPVNPAADEIDGASCFHSVREITPPVEGALVMTPASRVQGVVEDCDSAGVRKLWLYRATGAGAVDRKAVEWAEEHGCSVVAGECPLMFLPQTAWYHRAHGVWRGLTGQLPR